MRKLSALVGILSLVAVINCSKSEDAAPAPSIVGTWLETTYTFSSCDQSSDNGAKSCAPDCGSITFKSDGTFTQGSSSGTYSVSGGSVSLTYPGLGTITAQFTVTSTTLTVTGLSSSIRPNGSDPDGVDDCLLAITHSRQ